MAEVRTQTVPELPDLNELAFLEHMLADTMARLTATREAFHARFTRSMMDFEAMSLEQLGAFLYFARSVEEMVPAIAKEAAEIGSLALSVYREQEDTGKGVVIGVTGAEAYIDYRRRVAAGYLAAAEDAEQVVANLESAQAA